SHTTVFFLARSPSGRRSGRRTNRGLVVQRRVDLWYFLRLDRRAAAVLVGRRLPAEVEPERLQVDVAAVGADLLECREQLRLGLGPCICRRRDLLGRLDVDAAVALEARRGRDQLADDHVLLEAE